MHDGAKISLNCKRYESHHWSLSTSDVTLRLHLVRLDVARVR